MARKKPASRKRTKRNQGQKPALSVEQLIQLIERREDSDAAKKELDDRVASVTSGTVGAAKVVAAADALEDENYLLSLANSGLIEALRSDTMIQRILSEVMGKGGIAENVANVQAATAHSKPDDDQPNTWIFARFGDAVGVNGTILGDDDRVPESPENFTLTNVGGAIPETEEVVTPAAMASVVAERLGLGSSDGAEKAILEVLSDEFPEGTTVRVSGDSEIWVDSTTIWTCASCDGMNSFDVKECEDCGEPREVSTAVQVAANKPRRR